MYTLKTLHKGGSLLQCVSNKKKPRTRTTLSLPNFSSRSENPYSTAGAIQPIMLSFPLFLVRVFLQFPPKGFIISKTFRQYTVMLTAHVASWFF